MQEICLSGKTLPQGRYQDTGKEAVIIFRDANTRQVFAIDEPSVFQNILFLGSAGSGKTNILNQIVPQIRGWDSGEDSVSLIFDTKGDYIQHRGFFQPGDYIIGNSPQFRGRSVTWNIFDEVLADGDDPVDYEANAREIAHVLFEGRGSATQPFFCNAARDTFAHTLIYFIRRSRDRGGEWTRNLHNAFLKQFLMTYGPEDFVKFFSLYPDMRGLTAYFGDGKNNQALGVFGELRSMVSECFQGVFAREPKNGNSFSVRQAVRKKEGRAIFIEYDLSVGQSMTPMYRLLVDLALKEALGGSDGRTHLFLDELKLLPKVTHLQDALNFGRSKRLSVVAGIQNVDQIYSNYGESLGREILEGFGSLIALKTSDHASREYVTQRFGPNLMAYRYHSAGNQPVDREREGHTVEHWHQRALRQGQAVVGLVSQEEPFLFQFERDRF